MLGSICVCVLTYDTLCFASIVLSNYILPILVMYLLSEEAH
jgi:hypothetical protein